MRNCVAIGHAAGLAASTCAQKGMVPWKVKVEDLQAALEKDEVDLTMGGTVQDWLDWDSDIPDDDGFLVPCEK